MQPGRLRFRWPAGLLLVPLWAATAVGAVTGKWWTFSPGYSEESGYEDLRWIARWAECLSAGDYQNLVQDCQIAYPLPSIWIAAKLGFTQQDLIFVGASLAILWALSASLLIIGITNQVGFAWGALITGSLCAPPTWLLLERGNLDLIVWILTLLTLAALVSGRVAGASLMIALATLLKIFPVGMALGLMLDANRNVRRVALLLLAPALCAIAVVATGRYVSTLRPNPVGDAFASFHGPYLSRVLVLRLQGVDVQPASVTAQVAPATVDYVMGVILFVTAAVVVWLVLFRRVKVASDAKEFSWFLSAIGLILFAYLTGANFDYRLTFLSFVIAGVAIAYRQLPGGPAKGTIAVATLGLAAATWLGVGSPLAVQLFGDGLLWLSLVMVSALAAQVFVVAWRRPAESHRFGDAFEATP